MTHIANSLRQAFVAASHFWKPILLIQLAGLAVVIHHAMSPEAQRFWAGIGLAKDRGGLVAAFIAGAIAGGILGEVAKALTGKGEPLSGKYLRGVAFQSTVFGVVGIQVDLLYQFLAKTFGAGTDFQTIFVKVLADMLVFTPFISIPSATIAFGLYHRGPSAENVRNSFTFRFYRDQVLPVLPLTWLYWTPMVCLIYSLPTTVQFPVAMLAEAAWTIVFVVVMKQQARPEEPLQVP